MEPGIEQFEILLKHAPFGAYLVDADFRICAVNATALQVFGEIPDVIGRNVEEIFGMLLGKNYASEVLHLFTHTLDTGEPSVKSEFPAHHTYRPASARYEWHVNRLPLPTGRFGLLCYFRDVSSELRAREEIARSEARFRALATTNSDVEYQMSADWKEMHHLLGRGFCPDTEHPTQNWIEKYIFPQDRPHVLSVIQDAIRTKTVFELEHRVIRADGNAGWIFSRAIPRLNSRGEILEWFGAARDITERKRAEEAVTRLIASSEHQRRRYEAILSSTPDLVYVFDLNHRFSFANQALLAMWGKTAQQAIGKNCLELGYEPWHAAMHDREIDQVIDTKRSIRGDVPFSGTNGRRIYDYIFVPVLGADGEVEAIAGTTRDITERHMVEQELRRANQDLEQFSYAATHDLQEPLRSVKVYSQLLERRCSALLDDQALQYLNFVRGGATRMEMLIRDLLSYTQAGGLEPQLEPTDANASLEKALANLSAAISDSGAEISSESLPSVNIPDTQLQQVFQNLIGNAIKYRRPDTIPTIGISARTESSHCHFTVTDNGIGIEDQYKSLIFGLFKRLHPSDSYSGTGIGLCLCERIIQRNQGRIWVESQVGVGSQFHFTLPV